VNIEVILDITATLNSKTAFTKTTENPEAVGLLQAEENYSGFSRQSILKSP
jgi:hypothetical protein